MKPPKKTNKEDTILVAVWLPKELAAKLKAEAKARDLTKSQIIRKAIKTEIRQPA